MSSNCMLDKKNITLKMALPYCTFERNRLQSSYSFFSVCCGHNQDRSSSNMHGASLLPKIHKGLRANLSRPLHPLYRQQHPAAHILSPNSAPKMKMVKVSWENQTRKKLIKGYLYISSDKDGSNQVFRIRNSFLHHVSSHKQGITVAGSDF